MEIQQEVEKQIFFFFFGVNKKKKTKRHRPADRESMRWLHQTGHKLTATPNDIQALFDTLVSVKTLIKRRPVTAGSTESHTRTHTLTHMLQFHVNSVITPCSTDCALSTLNPNGNVSFYNVMLHLWTFVADATELMFAEVRLHLQRYNSHTCTPPPIFPPFSFLLAHTLTPFHCSCSFPLI